VTAHSFTGHIAGIGTQSGTRLVLGMWAQTPFGSFADAMIETPDGHRTLVAPTAEVADFIAATYTFDEVVIAPVAVEPGSWWRLTSTDLDIRFAPHGRLWLAPLLHAVPGRLGRTAGWARVCNPIARCLMPGVQTYGTAGSGRTEWYWARDIRKILQANGTWRGQDLGDLSPLNPPVRFGFASAPAQPSLTALTSYVRMPS